MNTIDLSLPVAELVKKHPEIKEILVGLGFKPLANTAMLETVGKVTTLKMGAKMIGIPLETIKETLLYNGYDIIGD